MLLQKLQQSQKNLLSTRVTIINEGQKIHTASFGLLVRWLQADNVHGQEILPRISHFPSKLRFSASYSSIRQFFSRKHYQPTYQPPGGVYLPNIPPTDVLQISNLTSTTIKLLVQNLIQDERGFFLLQRNEHVNFFYKVVPEDNEK